MQQQYRLKVFILKMNIFNTLNIHPVFYKLISKCNSFALELARGQVRLRIQMSILETIRHTFGTKEKTAMFVVNFHRRFTFLRIIGVPRAHLTEEIP